MADGSDQYIETRYSNDKPIWEGPKAEKKRGPTRQIQDPGAQLGNSTFKMGPKAAKNINERGPTRQIESRGAQLGKTPFRLLKATVIHINSKIVTDST